MRSYALRLGALALLVAATGPASAQVRTERVQFSGTSDVTLSDVLSRGRSMRYLVGTRAGKTLVSTALSGFGPSTCYVRVLPPGAQVFESSIYTQHDYETRGSLKDSIVTGERAGDYQVVLFNAGQRGTCSVQIKVG